MGGIHGGTDKACFMRFIRVAIILIWVVFELRWQ